MQPAREVPMYHRNFSGRNKTYRASLHISFPAYVSLICLAIELIEGRKAGATVIEKNRRVAST